MYVIDKENSIMDYIKQIKTVAAPKLQSYKSKCVTNARPFVAYVALFE